MQATSTGPRAETEMLWIHNVFHRLPAMYSVQYVRRKLIHDAESVCTYAHRLHMRDRLYGAGEEQREESETRGARDRHGGCGAGWVRREGGGGLRFRRSGSLKGGLIK